MKKILTTAAFLLAALMVLPAFAQTDDEGFVPLFNGKDMTGWRPCKRDFRPFELLAMTDAEREKFYADNQAEFDKHWTIENGELVNDGSLMVRASSIVEDMKVGAARALASLVSTRELNEKFIIPDVFDKRCAKVIAEEVASVAESLGLAKNPGNREW